jgi:hypothetical protein
VWADLVDARANLFLQLLQASLPLQSAVSIKRLAGFAKQLSIPVIGSCVVHARLSRAGVLIIACCFVFVHSLASFRYRALFLKNCKAPPLRSLTTNRGLVELMSNRIKGKMGYESIE